MWRTVPHHFNFAYFGTVPLPGLLALSQRSQKMPLMMKLHITSLLFGVALGGLAESMRDYCLRASVSSQ